MEAWSDRKMLFFMSDASINVLHTRREGGRENKRREGGEWMEGGKAGAAWRGVASGSWC